MPLRKAKGERATIVVKKDTLHETAGKEAEKEEKMVLGKGEKKALEKAEKAGSMEETKEEEKEKGKAKVALHVEAHTSQENVRRKAKEKGYTPSTQATKVGVHRICTKIGKSLYRHYRACK